MKMTPLSSVFRSVNGISLSINFRLLIVTVVVGIGAVMKFPAMAVSGDDC